MEGIRRRRGSIGNWEALMGFYWGFQRGGGALTSIHGRVKASVGDCLDQGGIFRIGCHRHLKQGDWKCVVFSPSLAGVSSQGSTVDQSSRVLQLAT